MKKKVLDAAFTAALLYGCESWFVNNINSMGKPYMTAIKTLLSVRSTTCNYLCLVELGYPPLQDLVKKTQQRFFSSVTAERAGDEYRTRLCSALSCRFSKTMQLAGTYEVLWGSWVTA